MSFSNKGAFVSRSTQLDISLIKDSTLDKDALKDLLVRLMLKFDEVSYAINNRRSGIHLLEQFANGESMAPIQTGTDPNARPMYQQTFYSGALLNAAATTIAHGITTSAATQIIGIEGWATDTAGNVYIPLPYVDVSGTVAAGNIELFVDGTNINIEPVGNATNFNLVGVTLRWIDI